MMMGFVEGSVAIKRIDAFLRAEELSTTQSTRETSEPGTADENADAAGTATSGSEPPAAANPVAAMPSKAYGLAPVQPGLVASFRDCGFGWGDTEVLHDITANIPEGKLTIVCGAIASGKSSFLQV